MILRRAERGLAWLGVMVLVALSLLMGPRMGIIGDSISLGLHAVAGHAAWLLPIWLFEVSCRTFAGCRLSPMRGMCRLLLCILSAVTLALLGAAGGWAGVTLASIFVQAFGAGAALLMFGTWSWLALRLVFRLLGAERLQAIAGQATTVSRQALAQYRPIIRTALPARGEVIDTVGETITSNGPPPIQDSLAPVPPPPARPTPVAQAKPVQRKPSKWDLPNVEALLQQPAHSQADAAYLTKVARDLAERLRLFRLAATVQPAERQGAIVSRYEITPAATQEIKPITAKLVDLEAAYKGLRFVPLSGTGKLGVEIPVPDSQRRTIMLREVLDSPAWIENDMILPLALGVTTSGDPVVVDLATCPHLLVAGATGAGKSVGVNVMLTSLLLRNSPSDLQLLLIDPKVVEFPRYRGLPHLLTPVITEAAEAIARLQWACEEMDRRYLQLAEADAENLEVFNETVSPRDRLPRIVIVIDEYADLTCVAVPDPNNPAEKLTVAKSKELVESAVIRLAQKARAAGIHVILATQRPSVDVLTGAIKANFPSRISYKTAQREDSKTIIGASGAEKLLGDGDSLFLVPGLSTELVRVHGAFVAKSEVKAVCASWTCQATGEEHRGSAPRSTIEAEDPIEPAAPRLPAPKPQLNQDVVVAAAPPESDDLFARAVEFARSRGYVSARQLGDEFGVGFNKSKKLFGRMLSAGLLKPGGPNNTHVFIAKNTLEHALPSSTPHA